MLPRLCILICAALIALATASAARAADDVPVIAAASDLQFAVREIAEAFAAETGHEVRLSFGSTGNIARQIRAGAPYQLFMAADEAFVDDLYDDGFTRDEGELYALGRIVLVVPSGSPLKADGTLSDLRRALDEGRVARFAIANPEHAPYGRRAEEALRHAGLWEEIRSHLVLGENVAQAAQFAISGNAEGGIIAHALALAPGMSQRAAHALIPEDWHTPLRQRMVLLKDAGAVAEAFYGYMTTPAARAVMRRHGFGLPEG